MRVLINNLPRIMMDGAHMFPPFIPTKYQPHATASINAALRPLHQAIILLLPIMNFVMTNTSSLSLLRPTKLLAVIL